MDQEIKQHLEAMESRMEARMDRMSTHFDEKMWKLEERLTEKMRDMQTELLRGFAAFSEGQTIRLRKVEADQSNLDAALSARVNVLERRLLEIELRLGRTI
jgi:flagellar biosynthesis/type III secretory pathway protein FliH